MWYLIHAIDKSNCEQLRVATRPEHILYIESFKDKIRLAGPLIDSHQKPIGTMIVIAFEALEDAQSFFNQDPYQKAGLFAFWRIDGLNPTKGSLLT